MDDESWQLGFKPGIWSWFSILKSNNAILHKGEKHRPSVEIENSFGKNQHPLMIKSLSKLEIEFSHPDRGSYKSPSQHHTLHWRTDSESGRRDKISSQPFHSALYWKFCKCKKQEDFIKGIQIKERKKAFYSQATATEPLSYLASLLL